MYHFSLYIQIKHLENLNLRKIALYKDNKTFAIIKETIIGKLKSIEIMDLADKKQSHLH